MQSMPIDILFQLTAARRRLDVVQTQDQSQQAVSTHSRPKAAGTLFVPTLAEKPVSTHSRPKAAGSTSMPIESGI